MLSFLNGVRGSDLAAIGLKMVLAILCGMVVGLERSAKNRPAGFRTHILVCLGATVAAMTGLYIYLDLRLPTDISRLSSQVISGLGFILAGTIVVTKKLTIKGLTTAAGLWTTGIIGLAIGSGYYEIGILGTALVLMVEGWFGWFGGNIRHQPEYTLELLYNDKTSLDHVLRCCKDNHLAIVNLKIHALTDQGEASYSGLVQLRGGMAAEKLLDKIRLMPGIVSADEL
ncbi:MAG: MgtC/SapB family protein [Clostridia bacterium]|nr:MgtC/SapB family protein [Clostridia bacterium]